MEAELGDAGRVSAEAPAPAASPDADRVILHVDLDAFFASVEQLRYPHLRGKPVIVGNGVIASCSYEARRRGCYAGQSLSDARRMCPGVTILDGCESVYRAFAEKTFTLCADLSPAMETFLDEAFLDLTGTERMHGDLLERAGALKRQVREEVGLPITAGLGPNRMLAKIASKSVKPDGLRWIRAEEIESVLPALPIDRLPGVGYRIGKELAKFNVRTIGDLRAFPAEVLERMFGAPGRALYERCRGHDTRAVEAREVPHSISRETAFHEPVSDPRTMESMLYYLLERAVRHARGLGLSARTLAVWIDYMESGREAAARSLGTPSDQDAVFFDRARRMLAMLHTRREALRRIGVALTNFSADAGMQGDLFAAGADVRRDRLYRGLDAVRARFGHASVVAGPSVRLIGQLEQDRNGFVLRTPSLTK
jgi:DNA polymerase-4